MPASSRKQPLMIRTEKMSLYCRKAKYIDHHTYLTVLENHALFRKKKRLKNISDAQVFSLSPLGCTGRVLLSFSTASWSLRNVPMALVSSF